jgi:hypothetical protein
MITKQGQYVNKATNETVYFDFEVANDVSELREITTEAERDALALRMFNVDSRNTTSAKTQAKNGHNQRGPLDEATKAQNKAKAQKDRELLKRIKSMSQEDIDALLG